MSTSGHEVHPFRAPGVTYGNSGKLVQ